MVATPSFDKWPPCKCRVRDNTNARHPDPRCPYYVDPKKEAHHRQQIERLTPGGDDGRDE